MRTFLSTVLVATCVAAAVVPPGDAGAQRRDPRLHVFGYFQNSFTYQTRSGEEDEGSFSLQQLNLFLQKDLSRGWTAFVNFGFVNSYSSGDNWGALALEEAWVKYRRGREFSLKMGLLIPKFNQFNEIKNKWTLIPYIIRPIVYETSFKEFIAIGEYVPERAFVQAYGYVPHKRYKLEYAAYLGNGPNINSDPERGQTGVDTTSTLMVGGRVGVRHDVFSVGFSATADKSNQFKGLEKAPGIGGSPTRFEKISRLRVGADLSLEVSDAFFDSEFIAVHYYEDTSVLDPDKSFYYATLGYRFRRLVPYVSYWLTQYQQSRLSADETAVETSDLDFTVWGVGAAHQLGDRVQLKATVARGDFDLAITADTDEKFYFYALAVSVDF